MSWPPFNDPPDGQEIVPGAVMPPKLTAPPPTPMPERVDVGFRLDSDELELALSAVRSKIRHLDQIGYPQGDDRYRAYVAFYNRLRGAS